jgi:hypothetical protein
LDVPPNLTLLHMPAYNLQLNGVACVWTYQKNQHRQDQPERVNAQMSLAALSASAVEVVLPA